MKKQRMSKSPFFLKRLLWVGITALILGAIGLGAVYLWAPDWLPALLKKEGAPTEAQQASEVGPQPVEAVAVTVAPFVTELSAVGILRSNESVEISPEARGIIKEIGFKGGEPVKKDQLLYRLSNALPKAELREAQAKATMARSAYTRGQQLSEKKFISAKELEELFTQYEAAEAAMETAQANLGQTEILAPFAGLIGLKQHSVGAYVNAGDSLVRLEAIDPLKVDFRVGEEHLKDISVGQKVSMTVDGVKGKLTGVIEGIEPQIDPIGHSILVRASVDNHKFLLRPGLFVNVTLPVGEDSSAIMIPEAAVETQGGEPFVYRVIDGVAANTPVVLGGRQGGMVQVLEGLWSFDTVVVAGTKNIFDGVPVKVVEGPTKKNRRGGQKN